VGTRRTGLVALAAVAAVAVAVVLAGRLVTDEGPDTRDPARLLGAPAGAAAALDLVWSADGTQLLAVDAAGVTVRDAASGDALLRLDAGLTVTTATWAADRSRVVLADGTGAAEVWDVAAGTEMAWAPPAGPARAWRPDGGQLAAAKDDGTIELLDGFSGDPLGTIERTGPTTLVDVAWLDTGRLLATSTAGVEVWDVAAGGPGIAVTLGDVARSAPSPDGSHAAIGRPDSRLHAVVDLADGTVSDTVETKSVTITGFRWSPDGAWLFVTGDDDRPRLWDAAAEATRDEYADTRTAIDASAWSPNSRLLAMASLDDDLVAVEGVISGETTRLGTGDATAADLVAVDWSPDGSTLAAVLADGTVVVWDVSDLS